VLNRLADGEIVREVTLRSASGASRAVLQTLLRKKWIAREDLSDIRDASRTVQIATLKQADGKLNANQQTIIAYLRNQEGQRSAVEVLRELAVPRTTLKTLNCRTDRAAG
jgi:primosomal protein N' (replication factor Y)